MERLTAKPGHRFEYAVTDADVHLRGPNPTQSIRVRQAADGAAHTAGSTWDFSVGIHLTIGELWWDKVAEQQPEYLPLLHTLGDWDTPTETVADLCAVLDRFGVVDATNRG